MPLLVAARPAAAAESEALELSWIAPRDCATVESVRQDVERVVGESGAVHRKLRAHGEVRRSEAGGWSVTLTLVTDTGQSVRALTAPTCRALARAAVVVIAFAMTTEEAESPRPADDVAGPPDDPPPNDNPAVLPKTNPEPPSFQDLTPTRPAPASRLGLTFGVFGRADVGTLPKLALGSGAMVGWYTRRLFLEANFGTLFGQDDEVVPPRGQSATISHATFAAFFARTALCPTEPGLSFAGQRLRMFACTGFGVLQTRVTGYPTAATIEGWSGSVFLGPRLRFADGWFAWSASADVAIPFRRQEFVLIDQRGGAASVHRTGAALVGVSIAVELSFF